MGGWKDGRKEGEEGGSEEGGKRKKGWRKDGGRKEWCVCVCLQRQIPMPAATVK